MITQWLVVLSNGSGGRLSGTYSKCIWPNNIDLFSPFVNDWMTLEKCKSKSCVFHAVSQALDRGKCEYGPFIIPSLTQTDPRKAFTDPWSKNKVFFPECVSIEQIFLTHITWSRKNLRDLVSVHDDREIHPNRFWRWLSRQRWRKMLPEPFTCLRCLLLWCVLAYAVCPISISMQMCGMCTQWSFQKLYIQ